MLLEMILIQGRGNAEPSIIDSGLRVGRIFPESGFRSWVPVQVVSFRHADGCAVSLALLMY